MLRMVPAPSNREAVPRNRPRRPGRPAGGDAAVREALLDSARRLFLARGFASVTIRQIAAASGSSPAAIHYHFGDKLGLYRAMLEAAFAPVAAALQRLGDPARAEEIDLAGLVTLYTRMLATNPWVPALIVQEVLAEGGRFRDQFIEHFAGRLAPLVVGIVCREQERGVVRPDADPRLAALTAISMTVFPFLALPVTGRVLGITLDEGSLAVLVRHTTRVLFDGLGVKEAAS
jgi:TetR/AcrR family transcriptional regulator